MPAQSETYLSQNPALHIDMMQAISRRQARVVKDDPQGVLLCHEKTGLWMLSVRDPALATSWLPSLKNSDRIVVRQDFCRDLLLSQDPARRAVACIQHVHAGKALPALPPDTPSIKALDERHLPIVEKHYSLRPDRDYLLGRLATGSIYGLFQGEKMAGFAGFHAEGAIGMLEVLPGFRRRGYGFMLQTYLTRLAQLQGHVPYTQVKCGNDVSMKLQAKCGYDAASEPIYWIVK